MTGDSLVREYASEYTEKVFYFCLRKCGNAREAEDLAQNISVRVLAALRRGNVPEHFPAWIWRIARNEFARWVADVKKTAYSGLAELDIAAGGAIDDVLLYNEDAGLLRRELAFIASDYREILVTYYIENRTVTEIAGLLNLPKGTVMSKLHRIRKKLKEGMEMSRDFGILSYKPEDIGCASSVANTGANGEPWSLISRKLSKNLLLAAYRTPSTAEQLAIELGIALPYTEDELEVLTRGTLMEKRGDRYETAYVIVGADTHRRVLDNAADIAGGFTKAVTGCVEYVTGELTKLGIQWHGGYQAYDDMKWALLMLYCDLAQGMVMSGRRSSFIKSDSDGNTSHKRTKRPYGGEWDITGFEFLESDYPQGVGEHGQAVKFESGETHYYDQYKFQIMNIQDQTPVHLENEQAKALVRIAQGRVSEVAPVYLDELAAGGHIRQENGGWIPAMLVAKNSVNFQQLLPPEQSAEFERLLNVAVEIADKHYEFCANAVKETVSDFLKTDERQIDHAVANMSALRSFVIEEALRTGYITYDGDEKDSAKRRMLGAYLVI